MFEVQFNARGAQHVLENQMHCTSASKINCACRWTLTVRNVAQFLFAANTGTNSSYPTMIKWTLTV